MVATQCLCILVTHTWTCLNHVVSVFTQMYGGSHGQGVNSSCRQRFYGAQTSDLNVQGRVADGVRCQFNERRAAACAL